VSFDFFVATIAEDNASDLDGREAPVADFWVCNTGRVAVALLKTDGALICRVRFVGRQVDALSGVARSFNGAMSVLVFALSALRRAGFFRGFLLDALVEDCILAAVVPASTEAIVIG
jgi:hypothetical protein